MVYHESSLIITLHLYTIVHPKILWFQQISTFLYRFYLPKTKKMFYFKVRLSDISSSVSQLQHHSHEFLMLKTFRRNSWRKISLFGFVLFTLCFFHGISFFMECLIFMSIFMIVLNILLCWMLLQAARISVCWEFFKFPYFALFHKIAISENNYEQIKKNFYHKIFFCEEKSIYFAEWGEWISEM